MERVRTTLATGVLVASLAVGGGWTPAAADEPRDDVPTPAEQAYLQRSAQFAADSARSSDLRLRIAYSMTGDIEDERRPDNGFYGVERVTAETLYADARGSSDPVVLDQLIGRCGIATKTMHACDRLALAERWTTVDAQNQVAWLTLAAIRKEGGDGEGARVAFLRAARASHWHSHERELARVVAAAMPSSLPPSMRDAFLGDALGNGGVLLPSVALSTLGGFCRERGDARAACARIVEVLVRDSDSYVSLALAPWYAARARVDPTLVATYQQEADAIAWALLHLDSRGSVVDEPDAETTRRNREVLSTELDLGQRRRAERALLAQGILKSDAAARHVATLAPAAVAERARRGLP